MRRVITAIVAAMLVSMGGCAAQEAPSPTEVVASGASWAISSPDPGRAKIQQAQEVIITAVTALIVGAVTAQVVALTTN